MYDPPLHHHGIASHLPASRSPSAPILLVLIRMLQGASVGGNYGGPITFVTEHAGNRNRGLIGSLVAVSCLSGFIAGSIMAILVSALLTTEQLFSWGWRIPFLFGTTIGLVGFMMRSKMEESPAYLAKPSRYY
ncbi:MFS transporter [Pajaroellobacter abortibovis]|uniref:Major facilitator superfamily (MFS) profile domain-containing protein n=1 Tax=Pajaroellobacter abortibovis TaxID=1882918 RepID=A0A1L6MV31_9BACT|nr:hypothetical protein BCY86_00750 [Pajaroellobacter abortibovis]